MVPLTGLEPVRLLQQGILSPWCLPIPPHRQVQIIVNSSTIFPCRQDHLRERIATGGTAALAMTEMGAALSLFTILSSLFFILYDLFSVSTHE